jgi:hypothetical protein
MEATISTQNSVDFNIYTALYPRRQNSLYVQEFKKNDHITTQFKLGENYIVDLQLTPEAIANQFRSACQHP